MSKINIQGFSGYVTKIEDFIVSQTNEDAGCYKKFTLENEDRMIVNFIISPYTYFVDHEVVSVGDWVTGYYDADVPVILIYPPQYQALIIVKENPYEQIFVSYFNHNLLSSDDQLQLNISPGTPILLTNGQPLSQPPGNHNLIVRYTSATKSIPAQVTPLEIIVFCRST